MTAQIQITLDRDLQLFAAIELSEALTKMELRHAFIGGFAMAALGSTRHNTDIDIMIDIAIGHILEYLRPQLAVRNHHFAENGLKFYFCPDLTSNRKGAELVRANTKNVLIETLSSRSLGLPPHLDPEMLFKNHELPILHPSVLILTKIKRWTSINMSTYPPNLRRAPNDLLDIAFLAKC